MKAIIPVLHYQFRESLYVDETGQDTKGQLFIVSVVVIRGERDPLQQALQGIERSSRKHDKKWTKSRPAEREAYMRSVLNLEALRGSLFYALHRSTSDYANVTIQSTAQALLSRIEPPDQATVLVDGLPRSERRRFAQGLRSQSIAVDKVRGVRDESDILIRLADALAGFVRNGIEGKHAGLQSMFAAASADGRIQQA
ncbi:MAG: hypothetical protein ETSY1_04140 [Candidatus Entotheonella factor]|uniref:DUF3800 domain-containing protein n=1 Tax=Entotheonella factor TaxID=1429438 RepID=W4LW45_ENTF1|nr:MAG: hypothetical protein ETSY1_04140 [Candidatus Entotheonella factor]